MSDEACARHTGLVTTYLARHTRSTGGFWSVEISFSLTKLRQRACITDLSHFSLLFLQGSQFIALRARFVGGRPSPFWSPGVRPLTVPAVAALAAFGRGGAEVVGVGLASAIGRAVFQD